MASEISPIFPPGCRAAVSFTYDDCLDVHLDHAIPDLEASGLRGTFYVPTVHPPEHNWFTRREHWISAVHRGHEIGNHTRHHPCANGLPNRVWVKFPLEEYDLAQMEAELVLAGRELRYAIGNVLPMSYAYTCCEDFVGRPAKSYRPICDRLFIASRGGSGPTQADPLSCDFTYIPSWSLVESVKSSDMIAWLDRAIAEGKWAVLQMHGVGGGHNLNVSRETHHVLCEYVARHRAQLWCETFVNVATHLRKATNRPWNPPKF